MATKKESTGTKKSSTSSSKEKKENNLHKIPLRITDTTLRDAHQSLWATRMRTDDILRIIDVVDSVGYYSLEVWGGATFDACLRFLRENPWERLRMIKSKAKNTPLQMLLRGQNLVGYKHYADDVVDRFVALACANGMDIFRVFDALNDTRNLEAAIKAVKKYGGHAQGTLSYTLSPVHTVEKYVQYAKEQAALGIDSLCIKDMAGILSPIGAEHLVSALLKEVNLPIQLHCHMSSGMAVATYVEGVRAGAGAIDCATASMAGYSSQPPVETLSAIFDETNYSADLDLAALTKVDEFFEELSPKRRTGSAPKKIIDPGILRHQIPGGMISNFRSQLAQQGALEKLPEAQEEVSRVRKDLGYPPLVTPTSQIVGTQAVMNVLSGERYKIVPNEVKEYLRGRYGRSPVPVDTEFIKKILGDEKPITHRPADDLEPMLRSATDGLDPIYIEHEEDIITYVLYPQTALDYFKWRHTSPEERSEIPADTELRKIREEKERKGAESTGSSQDAPARQVAPAAEEKPQRLLDPRDYRGLSDLISRAEGVAFSEIVVRKGDFSITLRGKGEAGPESEQSYETAAMAEQQPAEAVQSKPAAETPAAAKPSQPEEKPLFSATINSPLVGTFYSTGGPGKPAFVKVGDIVEEGAKVCIVEAMKLFNEIEAPMKCKIIEVLVTDGDAVQKDQPIIGIEPV